MKKAVIALSTFLALTAFSAPAYASSNFILDSIDVAGTMHLSVAGQNQLDTLVQYASTNFGYTGTSAYFADSVTLNPLTTGVWSHGCGINGTSLSGLSISDSCIPSGGGHVTGYDSLFECISTFYNGATFFDLASHSMPVPCIQFNWNAANNRYEAQAVANNPVNFGQIYFPTVYDPNAQAIAASSSLWQSIDFASSTVQCASGNIFSNALCSTFTFLFLPDPNITNQFLGLVSTSSPTSLSNRIPFSYFYDSVTILSGLQASTTQMVTWTIPFASLGLGSTTPMGNVLPNVTILSSTTITYWIGIDKWEELQTLLIAVLYLGMAYGFWRQARWLAQKHH